MSLLTSYIDVVLILFWRVIKCTSPFVQRPLQTLILLHVLFFWRNLCLCLKCGEPTKVSVTSRSKAKLWFSKFLSTISSVACSAGVLWGRVNFRELVIVYSAGHVWFGVRVDGEGKGAWKGPLSSFLTVAHFLVLISFSPQPSTAFPLLSKFKIAALIFETRPPKLLSFCKPPLLLCFRSM